MALLLAGCGGGGGGNASAQSDATFRLSGKIFIEPDSGIDADVERRFNGSLDSANNSVASAQVVSNPSMLGGYVSGTRGLFYEDPFGGVGDFPVAFERDEQDTYYVELLADQRVVLSVFAAAELGSTAGNNIALTLRISSAVDPFTAGATVTEVDIDAEGTQTLTVADDGAYFIELVATRDVAAPVLYSLSIGQSVAATGLAAPEISAPFVPGEVIVKFKADSAAAVSASTASPEVKRAGQGANSAANNANPLHDHAEKLRDIGAVASHYRLTEQHLASAMRFESQTAGTLSETDRRKWQTLQRIAELNQRDDVEFAEPNYLYRASAVPNDPAYALQWNLPMLQLPAAWDETTGTGAVVAVVDTGIDPAHEDLIPNISAESFDFIVSNSLSGDSQNGVDDDPTDMSPTYHGAHVAGIVAAKGDNGVGIAGVAYDAEIMVLRALGVDGSGTLADISNAILYAAGLNSTAPAPPVRAADVINLSLGISETDLRQPDGSLGGRAMQLAIEQAIARGLIVVAAAGNSSSSIPNYPAAYEGVIAVSSVNDRRTRSSFSNFGDYIDVAAPGGTGFGSAFYDGFQDGILSTIYASEYAELVGTSMAAPHVAGVAALMKANNSSLNTEQFLAALNAGELTDSLGSATFYGNGLINASKAMAWQGRSLDTALNVFPRTVNFNGGNTTGTLYLSNPGSGAVTIDSVVSSESWLEVAPRPGFIDGSGLGEYTLNVDISSAPQTGTADITIAYQIDGGAVEQELVRALVAQTVTDDDTVGQVYVYVLRKEDVDEADPESIISVYASVNAVKGVGEYRYSFPALPPGQYYLEASTDNDGDFFVFDGGEAKGAFPLLGENQLIEIRNNDLTNFDFDIGYQRFVSASATSESDVNTASTPNSQARKLAPVPVPAHPAP